ESVVAGERLVPVGLDVEPAVLEGGAHVVVMTTTHVRDLRGDVIQASRANAVTMVHGAVGAARVDTPEQSVAARTPHDVKLHLAASPAALIDPSVHGVKLRAFPSHLGGHPGEPHMAAQRTPALHG